jgi:hypothetical protein
MRYEIAESPTWLKILQSVGAILTASVICCLPTAVHGLFLGAERDFMIAKRGKCMLFLE